MTAVTDFTVYEQEQGLSQTDNSPYQWKEIIVETKNTADPTNTLQIDLTAYGITEPKIIKGWAHSSSKDYSEIFVEAPTTSGVSTVFLITVGGSTDNLKRTYLIGGN